MPAMHPVVHAAMMLYFNICVVFDYSRVIFTNERVIHECGNVIRTHAIRRFYG